MIKTRKKILQNDFITFTPTFGDWGCLFGWPFLLLTGILGSLGIIGLMGFSVSCFCYYFTNLVTFLWERAENLFFNYKGGLSSRMGRHDECIMYMKKESKEGKPALTRELAEKSFNLNPKHSNMRNTYFAPHGA